MPTRREPAQPEPSRGQHKTGQSPSGRAGGCGHTGDSGLAGDRSEKSSVSCASGHGRVTPGLAREGRSKLCWAALLGFSSTEESVFQNPELLRNRPGARVQGRAPHPHGGPRGRQVFLTAPLGPLRSVGFCLEGQARLTGPRWVTLGDLGSLSRPASSLTPLSSRSCRAGAEFPRLQAEWFAAARPCWLAASTEPAYL